MEINLPDINDIINNINSTQSTYNNEKKSIKEWAQEHKQNIERNIELIDNSPKNTIEIFKILIFNLLMRSMSGEIGAKIKVRLDKYILSKKDLTSTNFKNILKDTGYRFPRDGISVMNDVTQYLKNELDWEWKIYFEEAESNYLNNFHTDKLLKIKFIKYKVRDLALSEFNKNYIAFDIHIARFIARTGLLNSGFDLLNDSNLDIGTDISNDKNYLYLHSLLLKLSKETNNQYSPAELDKCFWHFGRTICKSNPKCNICPINNICLMGIAQK